jgi:hypothetical protein
MAKSEAAVKPTWPWRKSIQEGLAPVSIGLLLAGCFTFARGAVIGFDTAAIIGAFAF